MRKMNKVAAAVLAAAIVVHMAVPAFAADTNDTKKATVKYEVTESYTWNIHSNIDFGKDLGVGQTVEKTVDENGETNTVSVTKNVLGPGRYLTISVQGESNGSNYLVVTTERNNIKKQLAYSLQAMQNGQDVLNGNGNFLVVPYGTNECSANMVFTLYTAGTDKGMFSGSEEDTAEVAGKYTGSVTYYAEVTDGYYGGHSGGNAQ